MTPEQKANRDAIQAEINEFQRKAMQPPPEQGGPIPGLVFALFTAKRYSQLEKWIQSLEEKERGK